jgi:zinc transport system substrate-binding protein
VVATIQPVHSLAAQVMQGVGEPRLLIPAGSSPHSHQLRPSDARALQDADVVFWVGEGLEAFLDGPLQSLAVQARTIELMNAPGVTLLPARTGGAWAPGGDEHEHAHVEQAGRGHGGFDPHIWLDPANAKAMVAAMAGALAELDPANAATYRSNEKATVTRIDLMQADIEALLGPVRGRPFIVLHDAYQYFERAFGLAAAGSITITPDEPASAHRLVELRDAIRERGAVCVFTEAQSGSELARILAEDAGIGIGQLAPEGREALTQSSNAYDGLMKGNAQALRDCLSRAS